MAARGQQAQEQGPGQGGQEEDEKRPGGRGAQAAQREEGDGYEVLEYEDTDRDPSLVQPPARCGPPGPWSQGPCWRSSKRRRSPPASPRCAAGRAARRSAIAAARPHARPRAGARRLSPRGRRAPARPPGSPLGGAQLEGPGDEPQGVGHGYPGRFHSPSPSEPRPGDGAATKMSPPRPRSSARSPPLTQPRPRRPQLPLRRPRR